jgi:hypothetical protein
MGKSFMPVLPQFTININPIMVHSFRGYVMHRPREGNLRRTSCQFRLKTFTKRARISTTMPSKANLRN